LIGTLSDEERLDEFADDEFGEDRIKQYFEFMVRWKLELMN
jgi:hypothetical protein